MESRLFLSRRRVAVGGAAQQDATAAAQASGQLGLQRSTGTWTAGHEKESDFNLQKRFTALCMAVLNGSISTNELPTDVLEIVFRELHRRRSVRKKKEARVPKRREVKSMRGRAMFMEPEAARVVGHAALLTACHAVGARLTADRAGADMFVCTNPLELGQQTAWHVGLSGATVVDLDYLCSGGRRGVAVGSLRLDPLPH